MKYILMLLTVLSSLMSSEVAVAVDVQGSVTATQNNESTLIESGATLNSKMLIRTNKDASITIIFKDNSKVVLGSNSLLVLEKFLFKPVEKKYDFKLYLEKGSATYESGKIGELSPEDFTFRTPDSTVAIRGTKFFVKVQ